jgi:hypothetical protein
MYEKQYRIQIVGMRYKSIFLTSFFSASVFSSKDGWAVSTLPSSSVSSELGVTASGFSFMVARFSMLSTWVLDVSRSG